MNDNIMEETVIDAPKCFQGKDHSISFEDVAYPTNDGLNVHYCCFVCGATGFKTLYVNEIDWELRV